MSTLVLMYNAWVHFWKWSYTTHNQNTQQPNFPFDKLATLIKDFAHCGIMIPLTSVKKNCAISSFVWWQWSNQIVSVIGYICISEKNVPSFYCTHICPCLKIFLWCLFKALNNTTLTRATSSFYFDKGQFSIKKHLRFFSKICIYPTTTTTSWSENHRTRSLILHNFPRPRSRLPDKHPLFFDM